jgi:putative SbcD/Mre11-related phosphoesterase
MTIRFLADYPAAFITEKKILVVAELHIGLEHELYKRGIIIQPQAEKFFQIISKLLKETDAKTLVIIGDLKHEVPGISLREIQEIPKFLSALAKITKVIFCKGNHDTQMEGLIPEKIKVYESGGCKIGKYGFFHGHAWPAKELVQCDFLFMAHLQPGIEFRDKFGHRLVEQVWVRGKFDKLLVKKKYKVKSVGELNVIIMPAFNPLVGCAVINSMLPEDYMGPFIQKKVLDLKESKIYLLDGTYLGLLKNFKT